MESSDKQHVVELILRQQEAEIEAEAQQDPAAWHALEARAEKNKAGLSDAQWKELVEEARKALGKEMYNLIIEQGKSPTWLYNFNRKLDKIEEFLEARRQNIILAESA